MATTVQQCILQLQTEPLGDFFTTNCPAFLLSKVLGIGILAGSLGVKLPQILKIISAGSARGLSVSSLLLEMLGFSISLAYNLANGFPFTTFGELAFMFVQDLVILFLIFKYQKNLGLGLLLIVLSIALLGVMVSGVIPLNLLTQLQTSTIAIFIFSRVPQIWTTYSNKSSGQLAFLTWLLNFVGSIARVFTTKQETGDPIILAGYVVGVVLNGTIFAQILFYGDKEAQIKKKK
eukprot:TRINITY_DN2385_c0_g1_i1.p1 TRINITY_DN2385_c0_g1~~TRINITY_DN2385_c0_g1_i1.p1  ORF type:complete len:249 (-),score=80.01 TRINITY_DN2385_c0_g1_i1:45-746(-)